MPFSTYDILIALDVQSRGGGVLGVLQRDLASAATGVRNLGAAMSDTTRLAQQAASAQNALVAATSRLAAEQRLQQSFAASGIPLAAQDMKAYTAALGEHQAAAEASALAQQRLAASMAGPGAAMAGLGGVAVTGGVVAGAAALYTGYQAMQASLQLTQSVQDIIATTVQQQSAAAPVRQAVLAEVGTGERYTPQQLTAALYPLLSTPLFQTRGGGLDVPAFQAALRQVTLQVQPVGAQNITAITQADVFAANAFHLSAQQFSRVVDTITKGVAIGSAEPTAFATGISTIGQPAYAAGVSLQEAAGAFAEASNVSARFRFQAQDLARLFSDVTMAQARRPPAETRTAHALGVSSLFGPGAFARAGGLAPWLQQLQTATAGPYQQQLLEALFHNTTSLTAIRGLLGNLPQTLDVMKQVAQSGDSTRTAADLAARGQQAQVQALSAHWQRDLITLGDTLNTTVTPALVTFGNAALLYGEALAAAALKIGGTAGGVMENITKSAPWGALMGNNPFAQFLHTIMTPDWIGAIAKLSAPTWQSATSAAGVRAAITGPQFPSAFPVDARTFIAPTRQPVGPLRTAPPPEAPGITALRALRAGPSAPAPRTPVPVLTVPTAPSAFVLPAVRAPLGPVETPALRAARERDARQQAALRAGATTTRARTTRPRAGLTGPELIRRTPGGMFDPQAIFASQAAAWGSSVVQLAGGRANPQAELIRHLQQQLAKDDQQLAFLREVVRQLQLGNVLSRQQVAELDRLGALPGGTSTNVPRPTVAAPRSHVAAVR
jgi:hypothetical protein